MLPLSKAWFHSDFSIFQVEIIGKLSICVELLLPTSFFFFESRISLNFQLIIICSFYIYCISSLTYMFQYITLLFWVFFLINTIFFTFFFYLYCTFVSEEADKKQGGQKGPRIEANVGHCNYMVSWWSFPALSIITAGVDAMLVWHMSDLHHLSPFPSVLSRRGSLDISGLPSFRSSF